ncbi:MAG TPA: DUF4234 domain-containing protein [Vicinamibacterales bacterium]|nr:DUF4234 domain-containing protein [Vicinamibacterales bacterium]
MTASDRTNPYAPPKSRVVDPEPASHGLKRRSILVMILFVFVTFGLYFLIWWFRRRPGLNRLNSSKKIALWPLLSLAALYVIQFAVGVVEEVTQDALDPSGGVVLSVAQLVVGFAMILQAFRARDIIEDHAAPEGESGRMFGGPVELSGLMTFFFSIFYLQWAINRYVIGARA